MCTYMCTYLRTHVYSSIRRFNVLHVYCFQVFIDAEEEALSTYLITSSMFHGLIRCATRRLAYEYTERNGKTCPSSWHANKMAGVDWLHGFLKRRNDLGLRMPEATALSRATSFNVTHVSQFFDNFETIICWHMNRAIYGT